MLWDITKRIKSIRLGNLTLVLRPGIPMDSIPPKSDERLSVVRRCAECREEEARKYFYTDDTVFAQMCTYHNWRILAERSATLVLWLRQAF